MASVVAHKFYALTRAETLVYIFELEQPMNIEVDANEARTKLPELLRGIQVGNHYTITLRGDAVASLVSAQDDKHSDADAAPDSMPLFMTARVSAGAIDIRALINESLT